VGELLLCVLAAAPFAIDYTGSLHDPADLPQRAFLAAAAAAAAAWCARRGAASGEAQTLLLTPWHFAAAGFLAWCGLTGAWSRSGLEWWVEWRHWLLAGAAGAAAAGAGGRAAPWALAAFFASAAATALLALFQYFGLPPFSWVLQSVPPGATFGHRSFAMHWLVLGVPLGAALWAREADAGRRWALSLALGLIAGLCLLASARAAWLGGALEAVLLGPWLAWEARRGALPGPARSRWLSAAGGAALAAVIAFGARADYAAAYGGYSQRMSAIVTGLSGAPTSAVEGAAIPVNNVRMRLAIWRNSAAIVAKRPLRGTGLGNFQIHYPWFSRSVQDDGVNRENLVVDHAHNDPLEVLIETGAVGLALGLLAAGTGLWAGARLLRREGLEDRALAAGLTASVLGLAVTSLFCLPAHRALPPAAVAVFLGLLAGRAGGRSVAVPPGAANAGAAALTAAAVVLGLFSARALAASWHYGRVSGSLTVLEENRRAPDGVPAEEWARRQAAVLIVARRDAAAAADLSPMPQYLYTVGALDAVMGRWDEALSALIPYTERRPNHFRGLVSLALALKAKGRLDEALQVAGRAVNIRPESTKALTALAAVQEAKGLAADAAESRRRADAYRAAP
jgi:O-antigen ligase